MFKQLLITTRFGNLIIIGVAQWLSLSSFTSYNTRSIGLIIMATIAIALAGYIINDRCDIDADKINRPKRNLFERKFMQKRGLAIYFLLNIFGLAIGYLLDYRLLILFICTELLLFLYSYIFKKRLLIGNIVAALLQAAVFIPCLFFIDSNSSFNLGDEYSYSEFEQWFLHTIIAFAFLTSFFREWVKDLEDIEGDRQQGLRTSAIVFSQKQNKWMLKVVAILLIAVILIFTISLFNNDFYKRGVLGYYFLFLILPLGIRSLIMIVKQEEQEEWTKLSSWLKMLMLAGVLSIGVA